MKKSCMGGDKSTWGVSYTALFKEGIDGWNRGRVMISGEKDGVYRGGRKSFSEKKKPPFLGGVLRQGLGPAEKGS